MEGQGEGCFPNIRDSGSVWGQPTGSETLGEVAIPGSQCVRVDRDERCLDSGLGTSSLEDFQTSQSFSKWCDSGPGHSSRIMEALGVSSNSAPAGRLLQTENRVDIKEAKKCGISSTFERLSTHFCNCPA